MNVFITGSTGFIGSHLTEYLTAKNYRVKCLVRQSANLRWLKDLPVELVFGDLFDTELLKKYTEGADYIYHIAGKTISKNKEGYFLGNQIATRNLLQAAEGNKRLKRFIFASSLTAIGPSLDGEPVSENTSYHPITTYGQSKMKAELEVLAYKNVIPFTIVRLPAIYGPRDTASFDFFKIVNRGILPLIGFSEKYVSLLQVNDAISGLVAAAEARNTLNEIYFIGSDKFYTWKEIGEISKKILNRKVIKIMLPHALVMLIAGVAGLLSSKTKKGSILNWEKGKDMIADAWICDTSKAKNDFNYSQYISLEEGLRQTLGWYKENGWLK